MPRSQGVDTATRVLRSAAGRIARWTAGWIERWPLAAVAVLAIAVLAPAFGEPGLWEPQERAHADRVAPPADVDAERAARQLAPGAQTLGALAKPGPRPAPPPADPACAKAAPHDALARSLTPRAVRAGRDLVSDDDGGRRLPLVLLGLLCVLATAGTALRLGGPRAAAVTAIALLAMPLLVLQSRMLTSEIGTAAGAALLVYALVALARPRGALDGALACAALAAGAVLGFLGGGALLGLVVPIGAVAVAAWPAGGRARAAVGAGAALAAAALLGLIAWQIYDLRDPHPGIVPPVRQVFGVAIVPEGCWSWALGGVWRPEDDLRYIYDSTFEQIAYGTFPWGLLAPLAIALLLRGDDRDGRFAGALALAWGAGAWIATEVFQRKVGVTIWAGFPALALASGVWFARRDRGLASSGALLVALFVGLAAITLGKDMYSFAERVTSLLGDGATVTYPKDAELLGLPARLWPLLLGGGVALALAVAVAGRERAGAVAIAGSVTLAAFWAFAWHPGLARHLSSKTIFETYRELAGPGEPLVLMGDLGQAPRAYADPAAVQAVQTRDQVVAALRRPGRVFAVAPRGELCALHREIGESPYFVLEERNLRSLLLSNRVDGATDRNPLADVIVHAEPPGIRTRPEGRIVFDNKIELLGWDLPAAVERGDKFEVTLYLKVLAPVGGAWKLLMHFDGALRFQGDHPPIGDRCPTSTWQAGDYVIDRFTVRAGGRGFPLGKYELWTGFFTGQSPSYRNMPVSVAPPARRDNTDRVKIGTIVLE